MSADIDLPEKKTGVGAFIVIPEDLQRGFLSLEELRHKRATSKLRGMRSFPMETLEGKEKHEQVLDRLLFREDGGEEVVIRGIKNRQSLTEVKLGRYEIAEGAVLHTYILEADPNIQARLGSEKQEVANLGWNKFSDVLDLPEGDLGFRPGVFETVRDYLDYLRNPENYSPRMYRYYELRNQVPRQIFDLLERGINQTEALSQLSFPQVAGVNFLGLARLG